MTRNTTVILLFLSPLVMITQAKQRSASDVVASNDNWNELFRNASTARRQLSPASSLSTSIDCLQRRGDGHCDIQCDSSEFLRDLGDCSRPADCYECSQMYTKRGLCNDMCQSSGCNTKGLCPMGGTEQYVFLALPDITPGAVMGRFPLIEKKMNAQLAQMGEDVELLLSADNFGPGIYGHDNNTLKVVQMKFHEGGNQHIESQGVIPAKYTRAIFRVYAPFFLTHNDTTILDVIAHLGSHQVRAIVTPFILRKSDLSPEKIDKARSIYNKGIFSPYYGEIEKVFGKAIRFVKE